MLDWINADALPTDEQRRRKQTPLFVTRERNAYIDTMSKLAGYIPAGSVLVLNSSGAYWSICQKAQTPYGQADIEFAYMLAGERWAIRCDIELHAGDVVQLQAGATLTVLGPYLVELAPVTGYYLAEFSWPGTFNEFWPGHCVPYRYQPHPFHQQPPSFYQTCFSQHHSSARMDGGGRNLTPAILTSLHKKGVQVAFIEARMGPGWPDLPQRVVLKPDQAGVINQALAEDRLVIPVGAAVIGALNQTFFGRGNEVMPGDNTSPIAIDPNAVASPWRAFMSALPAPGPQTDALVSIVRSANEVASWMGVARTFKLHPYELGHTWLWLP